MSPAPGPGPTAIACWELCSPGEPLTRTERATPSLAAGEALIEVAGCGVCHTDLGFALEGVRPRHPLPLTLGHEIAGVVVAAGPDHAALVGRQVVVPAVIPCGACALCRAGRGMICRAQVFPGCDVHGGFASHVVVPAAGVCPVDEDALARSEVTLADLAVLGDAVSTAYQAIVRSELQAGELAIVVGAGGVGGFCAQIAAALGAHVVALDIDAERLSRLDGYGPALRLDVGGLAPKEVRARIRAHAAEHGLPDTCWKIFECSGAAAGQTLAYSLLTFGATLAVVGYTRDPVELRLSNLMAFDARAIGTWGCLPAHFPAVLAMVLDGRVAVTPFIERVPMSRINDTFAALHEGRAGRRPVLIPDFGDA
jgi:6-hydroxycyclohex-1-ene-1-carbonyl-CoA dehydrogenase